MYQKYQAEL
uniref:Uncharacterized protein n=1 Tax=Arundo donax TaxID=35708 RepID=A0A0A9FSH0_ARUDO